MEAKCIPSGSQCTLISIRALGASGWESIEIGTLLCRMMLLVHDIASDHLQLHADLAQLTGIDYDLFR